MDIIWVTFIVSVSVSVAGAACDGGDMVWCEKMDFQIVLMHMSVQDAATAEECKMACLSEASGTCKAVDYSDREGQCQLFNVTMFDDGVETAETQDVYHYWYVCNEACPSGDSSTTPTSTLTLAEDESFFQWLRDEPVWFALIGTGLLVVLLFIIIIALICRLKPNGKG